MFEALLTYGGKAVAAPQLGILLRVFITNIPENMIGRDGRPDNLILSGPRIFINPVIYDSSPETTKREEYCLSIPGKKGNIERPAKVTMRANDLNGTLNTYQVDGFVARIFQHESDHFDGKLYPDLLRSIDDLTDRNLPHLHKAKQIMEDLTKPGCLTRAK